MRKFGGKVLFLDRSDINTDEIIPAKYLTETSKSALAPYLLEDLSLAGFERGRDIDGKSVVVTRGNFGCGSSREHAPWALEARGITMVAAESFARIFRGNMFNCGMLAAELPPEEIDALFKDFAGTETSLSCDVENSTLTFTSGTKTKTLHFTLGDFDRALLEAGGWVEYAEKHY